MAAADHLERNRPARNEHDGFTILSFRLMATVKILFCIICLAFAGSGRGAQRSDIRHGNLDEPYRRIVDAARKEIGTREAHVPNTGPKVSAYLRYTGIKIPAPWCAAWVSYVFGQAGYSQPKTAWSPDLFPASRQVGEARPGLVLGIYYASLGRIGHCGIVESLLGDYVNSIEGNTSAANERDGDGVWRKVRHRRSIRCYADWVKAPVSRKGLKI